MGEKPDQKMAGWRGILEIFWGRRLKRLDGEQGRLSAVQGISEGCPVAFNKPSKFRAAGATLGQKFADCVFVLFFGIGV